jgi:hypothetical protein
VLIYKCNLPFSENFSNESNNIEEFYGNKIITLKKIKSLRQLRRSEKELVKLCYKEAIIKGFTLKDIQQYIVSKTKIWIEWSCLEYLKKTEELENREWYMRLAKDHFAYIGIYRDAIDQLHQLTHELWKIVMNEKSEASVKTAAIKEIHNIDKTKVLLLRDLPFITRLSKFYDLTLFNSSLSNKSSNFLDNKLKPISNFLDKDNKNRSQNFENQFVDNVNVNEALEILSGNKRWEDNTKPSKYHNIDDSVLDEMQRQSQID